MILNPPHTALSRWKENRKGDKTAPWSTPALFGSEVDTCPQMETHYVLLVERFAAALKRERNAPNSYDAQNAYTPTAEFVDQMQLPLERISEESVEA